MDQPQVRTRLVSDDFVALRSLARSQWHQDRKIDWKVNGKWRGVSYSTAPLDEVYRLMAMGLAESTVCGSAGCGRDVFRLTDRGKAFVSRMDAIVPLAESPQTRKALETNRPERNWFGRLQRALIAS